jgi:hypothetical protein
MGRKNELEAKLNDMEEKKQAVIKRFQVEMAVIEKMMEESDSDSIDELKTKVNKYRDLDGRYQSMLERKKKLEKELDLEDLNKKAGELKKEIEKLEEQLRKYPAFSMEINEMRKEIKRLEGVIRQTNPNAAVLKQTTPEAKTGDGFDVPDFGASGGDSRTSSLGGSGSTKAVRARSSRPRTASQAYQQLIKSGETLFEVERPQLIKHIGQRFNLYIQALFGKRYAEARIDPDGSVSLKSADGRWVEFEQLTPAARDTAFLALQITLLELSTQKRILPVILDNSALMLDETAVAVAGKAFKRVSERTQVVFFTAQRGPAQFADHSLNIG